MSKIQPFSTFLVLVGVKEMKEVSMYGSGLALLRPPRPLARKGAFFVRGMSACAITLREDSIVESS